MDFYWYVHKHIEIISYKYGWNHELDNKVICIYMSRGVGVYGARRNFRNKINRTKILLYIKLNFAAECHKMHYHLN